MLKRKIDKMMEYRNHLFNRWLIGCRDQLNVFAQYLQTQTAFYSARKKKRILLCFCLIWGGCYVGIVLDNLHKKSFIPFRKDAIQRILLPKQESHFLMNDQEFQKLQRVRRELDSLRSSASTKKLFDSLMNLHPHLLDTIQLLETIYYEQQHTGKNTSR